MKKLLCYILCHNWEYISDLMKVKEPPHIIYLGTKGVCKRCGQNKRLYLNI